MEDSSLRSAVFGIPLDVLKYHLIPYVMDSVDIQSLRLVCKAFKTVCRLPRTAITSQKMKDTETMQQAVLIFDAIRARRLKTAQATIGLGRMVARVDSTVSILNMHNCSLRSEILPGFIEALKSCVSLRTLLLTNTRLKASKAHYIADLLLHNTHLTELKLSGNVLKSSGVEVIADAMKKNSTLRSLDLWGIRVIDSPSGGACFESMLAENRSLTSLNVGGMGRFGFPSCVPQAVAAGLSRNTVLQLLDISVTEFVEETSKKMRDVLIANTSLKTLNFASSDTSASNTITIFSCLEHNSTLESITYESYRMEDIVHSTFFEMLLQPTCNIQTIAHRWYSTLLSKEQVLKLKQTLLVNTKVRKVDLDLAQGLLADFSEAISMNQTIIDLKIATYLDQASMDAFSVSMSKNRSIKLIGLGQIASSRVENVNFVGLCHSLAGRSCMTEFLTIFPTSIDVQSAEALVDLLESRNIVRLRWVVANHDIFALALTGELILRPTVGVMISVVAEQLGPTNVSHVKDAWCL
jgi:hypothetical protein